MRTVVQVATGRDAPPMRTTFHLCFRARGAVRPERAALLHALGPSARLVEGAWSGNPRDAYDRTLGVRGALSEGVTLGGRLGLEHARTAGPPDPEVEDLRTPQLELTGEDAAALDDAWRRLAEAFDAAGFDDETLANTPRPWLLQLAAQGHAARVKELRRQVTVALAARLGQARADGSVAASYTWPDDWEAVLAAVPAPARVQDVTIAGCGLTTPPLGLRRFPALRVLRLPENALKGLGALPASLPALEELGLDDNPLHASVAAELRGCRRLRVVWLRRTGVGAELELPGVTIHAR